MYKRVYKVGNRQIICRLKDLNGKGIREHSLKLEKQKRRAQQRERHVSA